MNAGSDLPLPHCRNFINTAYVITKSLMPHPTYDLIYGRSLKTFWQEYTHLAINTFALQHDVLCPFSALKIALLKLIEMFGHNNWHENVRNFVMCVCKKMHSCKIY